MSDSVVAHVWSPTLPSIGGFVMGTSRQFGSSRHGAAETLGGKSGGMGPSAADRFRFIDGRMLLGDRCRFVGRLLLGDRCRFVDGRLLLGPASACAAYAELR